MTHSHTPYADNINRQTILKLTGWIRLFATEAGDPKNTQQTVGRTVLMGGFRGTGKSRAVREALESVRNDQNDPSETTILPVYLHGPTLFEPILSEKIAPLRRSARQRQGYEATGSSDLPVTSPLAEVYLQIVAALYKSLRDRLDDLSGTIIRTKFADGRNRTSEQDAFEVRTKLAHDLDYSIDIEILAREWEAIFELSKERDFRRLSLVYRLNQIYAALIIGSAERKEEGQEILERHHASSGAALADRLSQIGPQFFTPALAGLSAGALTSVVAGATGAVLAALSVAGLTYLLTAPGLRPKSKTRVATITFRSNPKPSDVVRQLPGFLEQFCRAGWPPVFVIDELDKLPVDQTDRALDWFFRYFKETSASGAFFIFICDQTYLDHFRSYRLSADMRTRSYFAYHVVHFHTTEVMRGYAGALLTQKGEGQTAPEKKGAGS